MHIETLVSFWAFSLLFVFTPGADWAYVISAGMQRNRVAPAVIGLLAGYVILTCLVSTGVGIFIANNHVMMTVLAIVGSAYLAWLGWNMIRNPPMPHAERELPSGSWSEWAIRGVCVSGLNPKAFLFFLAFLPPWTDARGIWSVPLQIMALGGTYTASCSLVYSLVGVGANAFLKERPNAAKMLGQFSGVAMFLIAAVIIFRDL
ncbi:MAG: LysE family translocator [Gluconobacter oxydans]|uniref:LysE family translocator n=1 Tax=Gluconobacter oxydans TaxID=442 RepID=UPI0039EC7200